MKKILILVTVCLAGILLASCKKDEAQNILKLNNQSFVIDHSMAAVGSSPAEVHIDFDITSNGTHGFPRFSKSCIGKTVQLGKAVSTDYSIGINGNPTIYTMIENGEIVYDDFKSGSFTVKEEKEGYRFKLDGVLKNGDKLYIDVYARIEERW